MEQGEYTEGIIRRFHELWQDEHTLPYAEIADKYKDYYVAQKSLQQYTNLAGVAEAT